MAADTSLRMVFAFVFLIPSTHTARAGIAKPLDWRKAAGFPTLHGQPRIDECVAELVGKAVGESIIPYPQSGRPNASLKGRRVFRWHADAQRRPAELCLPAVCSDQAAARQDDRQDAMLA